MIHDQEQQLIQAREEDERATIIEALIEDDYRMESNGSGFFRHILTWGFDGYENVSTYDLRDEVKTRGLKL